MEANHATLLYQEVNTKDKIIKSAKSGEQKLHCK